LQAGLAQSLEDFFDLGFVFENVLRVDQNIVQVRRAEIVEVIE
jgi:hypothetical protein